MRRLFLLFLFIFLFHGNVVAATVTVNAATTGVNDTTVGGTDWTSLSDVSGSDDARASCVVPITSDSHYLRVAPLSLSSIPSGSTINGIEVKIERRDSGTTPKNRDNSIRLYKSGTGFVGDDKADTATEWAATDEIVTRGGATDLWGTTWTRDEVVNNLEIGISAHNNRTTSTRTATLDNIEFTIHYTPPASGRRMW